MADCGGLVRMGDLGHGGAFMEMDMKFFDAWGVTTYKEASPPVGVTTRRLYRWGCCIAATVQGAV